MGDIHNAKEINIFLLRRLVEGSKGILAPYPFQTLKANGIGNQQKGKKSIKERQRGPLRFSPRKSHALPEAPASGIGRFKEPPNGNGGKDRQQGGGQRQFGNVLYAHLEGNGVAHGRQDVIGAGDVQEGPKANPSGGAGLRNVLTG